MNGIDSAARLARQAAEKRKEHRSFLKKVPRKQALALLPDLHEEAFRTIDCLDCANCCKHYSPRFKATDMKRISKFLKLKEGAFIDEYLRLDEDGDYVVRTNPCPFLQPDNKCSIYEVRPRDCARYPYTSEDVLLKQIDLSLKNASICPAVFRVIERMSALLR